MYDEELTQNTHVKNCKFSEQPLSLWKETVILILLPFISVYIWSSKIQANVVLEMWK